MKFPMIVYKSEQSDYCGLFPDFPGLFLAEETLEDLLGAVQDAVETWMDGEESSRFPEPSQLDEIVSMPESAGRMIVLADIDPEFS